MKVKLFPLGIVMCLFAILPVFILSCEDDDNTDDQYTVSADASGAQEFPAVTTTATGTMTGTYNSSTNTLTYNLNWVGLTGGVPTAAHFHGPALPGANAKVLIPFTLTSPGLTSGTSGSVVLQDSVETFLLDGKLYWNVHNATYPGGEVRGQLQARQ